MHILVGGSISTFGRSKRKEINFNTTWLPCKIAWWYVKSFLFFVLQFHEKWQHQKKKSCVCIITHIEKAFDAFNCCISRDECTRATENVAWNAELLRLNRYAVWWGSLNCILRAKMCKFLWPTFMYILVSTAACTLYRNCKDASEMCERARARSLIIAFAFILLFHPKCHKLAANSIFAVQNSWKNSSDSLIWYLIILLNENQYGFWFFAPHFNFSN